MRRRATRRTFAAASIALAAIGVAALPARAPGQLPDKPGRLIVEPFHGFTWIHDPAERHAQEALAKALLAALEQDPAISHPVGYDVSLGLRAGDMPAGFSTGMKYFAGVAGEVRIYGQGTDDNGKPGIVQVDAVDLKAFVNDRWCGRGNFTESDSLPDHGLPIVDGMQPTPALHGHPTTDGMCVLVTSRPVPAFLPLTRDRYRRIELAQLRAQYKKAVADVGMQTDPDVRKQMDEMFAQVRQVIDSLQHVADAAGPADRAAAAAVYTNGPDDSSLVARGTEDSDPLDVPNPAFFDPALPRDRAQSIVLRLPYGVPGVTPYSYGEDGADARRAVFTAIVRGLPWAVLEAMVKH